MMIYSCEAVRALEEAVRGAKKAVQRSPDLESLLTLAEENLPVCNVNWFCTWLFAYPSFILRLKKRHPLPKYGQFAYNSGKQRGNSEISVKIHSTWLLNPMVTMVMRRWYRLRCK
jgi:hypothetical protein